MVSVRACLFLSGGRRATHRGPFVFFACPSKGQHLALALGLLQQIIGACTLAFGQHFRPQRRQIFLVQSLIHGLLLPASTRLLIQFGFSFFHLDCQLGQTYHLRVIVRVTFRQCLDLGVQVQLADSRCA